MIIIISKLIRLPVQTWKALTIIPCLLTLCYGNTAVSKEIGNADEIKAAYIYNLLKFTNWPSTSTQNNETTISICLSGSPNSTAKVLADKLRNRSVQNKALDVIYIPELSTAFDEEESPVLSKCMLVYLGPMSIEQERSWLNYAESHSILTISDNPEFAHRGGIVELKTDTRHGKILIGINVDSAQKANITFSSKLLQLVELIKS